MTIKWNLPEAMFKAGVFSLAGLRKKIKEKTGYEISSPALYRLIKKLPKEIRFETLDALCQTLDCEIKDIIRYLPPSPVNRSIQPLILEPKFKLPNKSEKNKPRTFKVPLPPKL